MLPGGIDVHTHLDMPFGGTTSADDFEIGHDRRGVRRHDHASSTSPSSTAARRCTTRWETWMKKAEGKAAIDYGFHMIMTELHRCRSSARWTRWSAQGVTSFKLFMAYPGVFMLDDASIFRALLRTGKNGGTICMHAENGGVIDVLVQARRSPRARPRRSITR